jgi:GntR family transcriptional regulator/MocR family aminotransferase
MTKALFLLGQTPPLFLQAALAEFINEGHFARHLRRMRRLYARRRSLFMELLPRYLGEWLEPMKGESGLQTVWRLKGGIEDTAIAQAALDASICATPLSVHYRHGSPEHGLILGFTSVDERDMHLGLKRLRSTFQSVASANGGAEAHPLVGDPAKTRTRRREKTMSTKRSRKENSK